MPSSHLILCRPLLLLPTIPPSIRVCSNESALRMRWPEYWSFNFSISPSNEHPGLICFRLDWLDLLAVQGTLKSLLQHHSSKASIFQHPAFFTVQRWHLLNHGHLTGNELPLIFYGDSINRVLVLIWSKELWHEGPGSSSGFKQIRNSKQFSVYKLFPSVALEWGDWVKDNFNGPALSNRLIFRWLQSFVHRDSSGGDGIPAELFQILRHDAVKVMHSICQQIWKISSGHRTGKSKFSSQTQRKAMPKNVQTTTQLHSSHMLAK